VAFDWASHDHQVSLFDFDSFPENIGRIKQNGRIYAEGQLEGFARVSYAGHDIGQVINGSDIVFAVGPAYSTKPFAEASKPYLRKGQTIIICPGSCGGSIEFKNGAGLDLRDESVVVAETSTLPYAVRLLEPGRIRVFLKLKGGLLLASVPARNTQSVLGKLKDVYPAMSAATNILQTSLQNCNPVIHPAITLLNAARIERTEGNFMFYEEGVTRAVGRVIKAIDDERMAIGKKLGIDLIPDPQLGCLQGYMKEATYDRGYSEAPGFMGIKAQSSLDYRYFNEDVGYGLVLMYLLGKQIGVDTPHMSAMITIASSLMSRDYLGEAKRTMESLGLAKYSAEELGKLLA